MTREPDSVLISRQAAKDALAGFFDMPTLEKICDILDGLPSVTQEHKSNERTT